MQQNPALSALNKSTSSKDKEVNHADKNSKVYIHFMPGNKILSILLNRKLQRGHCQIVLRMLLRLLCQGFNLENISENSHFKKQSFK